MRTGGNENEISSGRRPGRAEPGATPKVRQEGSGYNPFLFLLRPEGAQEGLILWRPFRASKQNIKLNCCGRRPPRALPWAVMFQAFGLNGGGGFRRGGRNLRK